MSITAQLEWFLNDRKDCPKLGAAIFDFDGVIADTEPLHARSFEQILPRFNVPIVAADFAKYIGKAELAIYQELSDQFDVRFNFDSALQERLKAYLDLVDQTQLRPYYFIRPILQKLADISVPCAIVSSQRPEVLKVLLESWELAAFFADVLSVYGESTIRPKMELALSFAREMGSAENQVVLFEDSARLIEEAKSHGFATVYIHHLMNNATASGADLTIDVEANICMAAS